MLRGKLGANKIYLVLDNWSVHRSKKFKAYVKQDGEIEVCYLPKNASYLNLVERKLGDIQRDILQNSSFQSVLECRNAIRTYVKDLNKGEKSKSCPNRKSRKYFSIFY